MKYWLMKSEPDVWSIDQQKNAGVEVDMFGVMLTPKVKGAYSSATNFDFVGSEVKAAYGVGATTAYVTVTADDNWKYKDTTVGLSFRF